MQPHEIEEQVKKIRQNQEAIIELLKAISSKLTDISNRVGA
jgi:hypothetical protein